MLENRIRIQSGFDKTENFLKKFYKESIQQVQVYQTWNHQFPGYRKGKSKQDYSCTGKMQSESQAKHESTLLRCCKKANCHMRVQEREDSAQNRQSNHLVLLSHSVTAIEVYPFKNVFHLEQARFGALLFQSDVK